MALTRAGEVAVLLGRTDEAKALLADSLAVLRDVGARPG
jgi:hypothetical protein